MVRDRSTAVRDAEATGLPVLSVHGGSLHTYHCCIAGTKTERERSPHVAVGGAPSLCGFTIPTQRFQYFREPCFRHLIFAVKLLVVHLSARSRTRNSCQRGSGTPERKRKHGHAARAVRLERMQAAGAIGIEGAALCAAAPLNGQASNRSISTLFSNPERVHANASNAETNRSEGSRHIHRRRRGTACNQHLPTTLCFLR